MTCHLQADRKELTSVLKALAQSVKGKTRREVILSFADGVLTIRLAWFSAQASATGTWSGLVAIPGHDLVMLGRAVGKQKEKDILEMPVTIRLDGRRVIVGNDAFPLQWYDEAGDKIHLPLNAELSEILALRYQYSYDEIKRSDYDVLLVASERKRDRVIDRAHKLLNQFSITREEIESWVEESIKRKYGI